MTKIQNFQTVKKRLYILAYITLIIPLYVYWAAGIFVTPAKASVQHRNIPEVWRPLVEKLVNDGEDTTYITALFSNPKVRFRPEVMPRKIVHNEAALRYDAFLKPARIKKASTYMKSNISLLNRIEQKYGVPKEIMVAILLVETDLGNYLGSGLAFNILASMAAATTIEHVKALLPPERLKGLNRSKVEQKLKKKSAWAYNELRALLKYATMNKKDILKIKGSIFGAIGLCQFMPTNILKLGVDFDKDGYIDVFSKADALASMANYLKFYGWSNKLSYKQKRKVIMHYNHSRPYANTVLKVAERLS
jgi:membrane-bound lytic murein transglycosylase B